MLKSPLRSYRASGIGNCADLRTSSRHCAQPSHQIRQLPGCGIHGEFLLLARNGHDGADTASPLWEVNGPSSVAVRGPSLIQNRSSVIDLSKVTIVPSPHIG